MELTENGLGVADIRCNPKSGAMSIEVDNRPYFEGQLGTYKVICWESKLRNEYTAVLKKNVARV